MDTRVGVAGVCGERAEIRAPPFFCVWLGHGTYRIPVPFRAVISNTVQTSPKLVKKAKASLDVSYSTLGCTACGRDTKGRVTKDDSAMSADMQAAGHMGDGGDYSAYVCYEFEVQ